MLKLSVHGLAIPNTKGDFYSDTYKVSLSRREFVVADGVSRSERRKNPFPYSAWFAAEAFCKGVLNYVEGPEVEYTQRGALEAFRAGNKEVQYVNRAMWSIQGPQEGAIIRHGNEIIFGGGQLTDYLLHDLPGVCASIGIIDEANRRLLYGFIGDCGVSVFDKNDEPKLITPNPVEPLERYRDSLKLTKDDRMIHWRRDLRNHPEASFATYGVATGEATAEPYFITGKSELVEGDLVIFYSDGMKPLLTKPLREAMRTYPPSKLRVSQEFQELNDDDKTLVAFFIAEMV